MFDFAQARNNMVDSQLRPNGVTNALILDAMQSVKREEFVGESEKSIAYMDGDISLKSFGAAGRFMIEPMAFARMLQAAEVKDTDKVLVVGAGPGYGAAVLAKLVDKVVAVESDANLAAAIRNNFKDMSNVSLIEGNLADGAPNQGPYDLIVIEGRVAELPKALLSQVKDGGRIVASMGIQGVGKCCIWVVSGKSHTLKVVSDMSIAALPGFSAPDRGFAF